MEASPLICITTSKEHLTKCNSKFFHTLEKISLVKVKTLLGF